MIWLVNKTALLAGSFHGINLEDFKYNTKKANPSDSPKHLNYKIIIKKKKQDREIDPKIRCKFHIKLFLQKPNDLSITKLPIITLIGEYDWIEKIN